MLRSEKKLLCILLLLFVVFGSPTYSQEEMNGFGRSLEDLLNIKINTAAKYDQKVDEAPASVTIVTHDEIERYGYQTLTELLNSVTGFYTRNDRNYDYIGVRGFGRPSDYDNRILLMINGHIINEAVYGAGFYGTDLGLDLNIVERVEIVRGPGSALYGTGALFAVVNVITRNGKVIDGFNTNLEIGSYGRKHAAANYGKQLSDDIEFVVSALWGDIEGDDLYYEEYDDSTTNYGVAENLDWDKFYGLFSTLEYKDFSFQAFFSSRRKGIPTGAWEMEFNNDGAETLDEFYHFEAKYEKSLGIDKNIVLRGFYDDYTYEGIYPYLDSLNESYLEYDGNQGSGVGGELQFIWDIVENNRFTAGTEIRDNFTADYRYWTDDEVYFDDNYPFTLISFYLQDYYQIYKNLSLNVGARYDDYSTSENAVTPRASLVYNPFKSTTLKLLYSEAFRAPNVYEKYYEDEFMYIGNTALKPEKIKAIEFVCEQRLSKEVFASLSVFDFTMNNLIDQVESDTLLQFQNIDRAKGTGFELELNSRFRSGIWGYLGYSYQYAQDEITNTQLSNSPTQIVKSGLSTIFRKKLTAAMELQYETGRKTVYDTKTQPFLITNLNFRYQPKLYKHSDRKDLFNIGVYLQIRNLFDESYSLPGGLEHLQEAVPQDGRNFVFGISYSY